MRNCGQRKGKPITDHQQYDIVADDGGFYNARFFQILNFQRTIVFSNSHLLLLAYTDNSSLFRKEFAHEIYRRTKESHRCSLRNGGSIRLICSEFNIPRSTLYRWFKTYKVDIIANGTPFTAREINQMQNRIVKLNNIIAILKTANCNCICTIARTF